jgi:hypothetical protein
MTTPDPNAFAAFIPGFEFLQNLTRQAAAGGASGQGSAVPGMPPMSHWVAPTFDVEELEKRIQDLKAVHFWLEQNTKALAATIQALEVQRMTLSTLQGMNVSMQEMADAFKASPSAAANASTTTAQADENTRDGPAAKPATNGASTAQADPMQWWGALTDQFQTIAAGAMQDMNEKATQMMAASQAAEAPAKASKPKAAVAKKTAASASKGKSTPARAPTPAKKATTSSKTRSPKR